MIIRFETFDRVTLRGRRYFFRIVRNGNNEIMAQSQPYKHEGGRDIAIGILQESAGSSRIKASKR